MHTPTKLRTKQKFAFICFFLVSPLCHAADTITANSPLSWNQTLVSASGVFELGFFRPGSSSKYYIGMWYKQDSELKPLILWVANRDKPVLDKYSAYLRISHGNLVLTNSGSDTPIWSTNLGSDSASLALEAVLLDSGNFILRNGPNSTHPLWQSADHPTHVWLPGYKIGHDKRTGANRGLTSWKNSGDPASGLFSYRLDLNGTIQFVMKWNGTVQYSSSGPWDATSQSFALLPMLRKNPRNPYNISYYDNENETYFTYEVGSPALQTLMMDVSGQLKSFLWEDNNRAWLLHLSLPEQQCDVYHVCGPFNSCHEKYTPYCSCLQGFQPKKPDDWNLNDYSSGCSRKKQLRCINPTPSKKRDEFLTIANMALPENPLPMSVTNRKKCELACLNNCSCTAYTYGSNGCSIWLGDIFNANQLSDGDPDGKTLYIRLNASEFQARRKKNRLIGIAVGSALGLSVFIGLVCIINVRRKRLSAESRMTEFSLMQYRFKELHNATKKFSETLGRGSFGTVFKGRLSNSSFVAVKMLQGANQGEKQFRAEVSTIGKIQHVNLVRLLGFCYEGSKRLLVYEYMPNGSLNIHLFREKNAKLLSWEMRYQIALGVAKGLAYLHDKCRDCIIHCDIKPENILLDVNFRPKIADFGLAKLVGRDFSRVLTTMRGTRGYLAPEWISGTAITTKADVYSYGMMLFELMSGRRNTEQLQEDELDFYPARAVRILKEDNEDILSIVDQRLKGIAEKEEVTRLCKLASWCIQDDEDQRPTMGQTVQILEGALDLNMPPTPEFLQIFAHYHDQTVNSSQY